MAKAKIELYTGSAGGWGALVSTSKHLLKSEKPIKNIQTLLKTNKHKGFDCPGCAWGDEKKTGKVNFCENGAKAVNWEATSRTVGPEFFAQNSVSALDQQSDYFLESQGRLTEPLRYNALRDRYEAIGWDDAFAIIADHLNRLDHPDQAEFYTSGRASNEAAFLYQLFVRSFGTNNFPDCSNMCHEASGVALTESIGVGKGTVTLKDFEDADAIFVFGQNPGTNHPRMLDTLRHAAKNGAAVVSFNNLRERGLERFTHPQQPLEMLTNGHTQISSHYFTPRLGGDMALVRGIVKCLLDLDAKALAAGDEGVLDRAFIQQHTSGMDAYLDLVRQTEWDTIEHQSGLTRNEIRKIADIYARSERVICSWAMGITQHLHSVATIQEIVNLLLLRGNIGRPGTGACPVRGHSNVQGDRTMGINEKPPAALIDNLDAVFARKFPRRHGHNAVQAVEAMRDGSAKVFIALGGNFAAAMSDTDVTRQALRNCDLVVNIATKLNRSHLTPGKQALILPCLGRTELDITPAGEQQITVEDSMSMVHASGGLLDPVGTALKSEVAIIAGIAQATVGCDPVDWIELGKDNDAIRDLIARCIPGFENFNQRLGEPGGFYLGNAAARRVWKTHNQKANAIANPLPHALIVDRLRGTVPDAMFSLQTLRSHDQYNTTIYGLNDRYRGVKGLRNVVFMNEEDMRKLDLQCEQEVSITSHWIDGSTRKITGFKAIPYDIPQGNMAAYYPETNPLVPLQSYGERSFTPTSKSIAITVSSIA
ncbi:MAG: FdhF/YdeP family oxidoreductase [Pseudomonadota bacterium]